MANPVVHFEMQYQDAKRVSKFYSEVFDWKMNDAGPGMGGYILANGAETDDKGMIKTPGTINGGFYDVSRAEKEPSVVISVKNIKEAIKKVVKAGGKILGEVQTIPGVGLWVSFRDSEGNRVSMMEEKR